MVKTMARKAGLDPKEQLIIAMIGIVGASLFNASNQMKAHIADCASRSATVSRIGYGILVIVAAGLIMNGINAWHTNAPDTTQKITTYEEKHIK